MCKSFDELMDEHYFEFELKEWKNYINTCFYSPEFEVGSHKW